MKKASPRSPRSPRMRRSNSLGSAHSSNDGIFFLSESEDSIGSSGSLHRHTKEKRKALTRRRKKEERIKRQQELELEQLVGYAKFQERKEEKRRGHENEFLPKKEYEKKQEKIRKIKEDEEDIRRWLNSLTPKDHEQSRRIYKMQRELELKPKQKGGRRKRTRKR